MLLVKAYVGPSQIHGKGLFAAQDIPEGEVVWSYNPLIDFTSKESPNSQVYAWLEPSGLWYWCGDNGKFINHSFTPTLICNMRGSSVAARNIKKGEELTENYSLYDLNWVSYGHLMK